MKRIIFISMIIMVACSIDVFAQQGQYPTGNRAAQYFLGSEDQLLVPVNIWGFVQRPGQYMVPNNTDLISLISYAGGPTEHAKINKIRIVRNDPQLGTKVWVINVKEYLETGDQRIIPLLRPGDTIVVKGTTFHWISRLFEFMARIATIAQIFYFVAIAQNALN